MNRAAWRRLQFQKVTIYFSGGHYDGPLGFLKTIADYIKSHERVTTEYGLKVPKECMKRNEDWKNETALPLRG
jgi:hypothetical protein